MNWAKGKAAVARLARLSVAGKTQREYAAG